MKSLKYVLLSVVLLVVVLSACDGFRFTRTGEMTVGEDHTSVASESIADVTDVTLQDIAEKVTIERVVDGDTVEVVTDDGSKETVRLLLIDTPETVHPDKHPQPYGMMASDIAKMYLVKGDEVWLERGNPDKDKYDRTLGYIWFYDVGNPEPINFNHMMIEEGLARVAYVYEPNTKYLDDFKQAESKAKEKQLNIWSIEGYVTDDGFDDSVTD